MNLPSFGFNKLDRYVAKICLGSFLVCIVFILGLFIIGDLIGHLERFLGNIEKLQDVENVSEDYAKLGWLLIVEYYLISLPFSFMLVAPFVTVTAGMFAVSRLMGANEIVPMLFTGRSMNRILVPVFLMGLIVAGAMGLLREYCLPHLQAPRDQIFKLLYSGGAQQGVRDKVVMLPGGEVLMMDEFFSETNEIRGLRLYYRHKENITSRILAAHAIYRFAKGDSRGPIWELVHGRKYDFVSREGVPVEYLSVTAMEGLDPANIRAKLKDRREFLDLSFSDLVTLIRDRPEVTAYSVYFHYHLTFPLANLILLLLAIPFALRFECGSKTERVFFALLVCGAYLVTDEVSRNLGTSELLHPVVAAWFPTVLFGSLGVMMYDTTRS